MATGIAQHDGEGRRHQADAQRVPEHPQVQVDLEEPRVVRQRGGGPTTPLASCVSRLKNSRVDGEVEEDREEDQDRYRQQDRRQRQAKRDALDDGCWQVRVLGCRCSSVTRLRNIHR